MINLQGCRVFPHARIDDLGTVIEDEGGQQVKVELDDGGTKCVNRDDLTIWSSGAR